MAAQNTPNVQAVAQGLGVVQAEAKQTAARTTQMEHITNAQIATLRNEVRSAIEAQDAHHAHDLAALDEKYAQALAHLGVDMEEVRRHMG